MLSVAETCDLLLRTASQCATFARSGGGQLRSGRCCARRTTTASAFLICSAARRVRWGPTGRPMSSRRVGRRPIYTSILQRSGAPRCGGFNALAFPSYVISHRLRFIKLKACSYVDVVGAGRMPARLPSDGIGGGHSGALAAPPQRGARRGASRHAPSAGEVGGAKGYPPTKVLGKVQICPLKFVAIHPANFQPFKLVRTTKPLRKPADHRRQRSLPFNLSEVGALFPLFAPRA